MGKKYVFEMLKNVKFDTFFMIKMGKSGYVYI